MYVVGLLYTKFSRVEIRLTMLSVACLQLPMRYAAEKGYTGLVFLYNEDSHDVVKVWSGKMSAHIEFQSNTEHLILNSIIGKGLSMYRVSQVDYNLTPALTLAFLPLPLPTGSTCQRSHFQKCSCH